MMQKYMAGQEPAEGNEAMREGRSAEEIREIIRTIESYLERTKESMEKIERFLEKLKEESRTAGEREQKKDTDKTVDPGKEGMTAGIGK